MSDTGQTNLSTEVMPSDGYLQPRRYKITARCDDCGTIYSWISEKITKKDRACPDPTCVEARREKRSAKEQRNFTQMVEERRPPGHIGDKPVVKAIDTTAEVVMQDYGLTDLKDNIRQGDAMAPKLPGPQQRMADGFFNGAALKESAADNARQAEMLRRRAIGGAYRGMAINPQVASFGRQAGEAPLRVARTEKIG